MTTHFSYKSKWHESTLNLMYVCPLVKSITSFIHYKWMRPQNKVSPWWPLFWRKMSIGAIALLFYHHPKYVTRETVIITTTHINNKNISYAVEILELLELIKWWVAEPESPRDSVLHYNLLEIFHLIWVIYWNSLILAYNRVKAKRPE